MTKLPETYRKYFWDCRFDELTLEKYASFIIERLLNYGNEDSIKWIVKKVNKSLLETVVNKSRNLDKKTKNYWSLILNG